MLIGQSVTIPGSGDPGVTYYGPWTPRQGDSGTAVLEVYKVSGASGWSVQYRVETKNAEDPDSAATSLGSVNITAAGTHRAQFGGCLELVRVRYICTGGGTDRWIHMRSNPIQWQPN